MKKIFSLCILILTLCFGSICFAGLSQTDLMWEYVKYAGGTPPSEYTFNSSESTILKSNKLVIYKGYKSNSNDECLFFRSPSITDVSYTDSGLTLGYYNEYYLCFNLTTDNYEGYLKGFTVYDRYSLHDSSVMSLDEFKSDNYIYSVVSKNTLYTSYEIGLNGTSSMDFYVGSGFDVLNYPSFVSSSSGHICNYTEAFLCLKNNNNADMSDFYVLLDKFNSAGALLQSVEFSQISNPDDMWLTIDNVLYTANLGDMIFPDTSEDVYYKARVKSYSLDFYEVESSTFNFYHNCAKIVSSSSGYVSNYSDVFLCINVSETQDFKDFYLILETYSNIDNVLLENYELKNDNMWLTLDGQTYTANVGEIYNFNSNKEYYYRLKLKSYLHPYFEDISSTFYFTNISVDEEDGGNVGSDIEDYLPYFISVPAYPQSNECLVYFYIGDYGLNNLSFLIEKLDSNNEILSSTPLNSSIINNVNYGMAKVDFCKYFKFEDNSFYRFTLVGKNGVKLDTSSIVYFLGSNNGNYEGNKPYIINSPKGYIRNSGDIVITIYVPSDYDYEDSVYLSVKKYDLTGNYINSTVVGDSNIWVQLDIESGICPIYVSSFCDFDTSLDYYYKIDLCEFQKGILDTTDIFYFNIDTGENIDKDNLPINPNNPSFNFDTTDINSLINSTTTWTDSIFGFLTIFPDWLNACIMAGIAVVVICRILGR